MLALGQVAWILVSELTDIMHFSRLTLHYNLRVHCIIPTLILSGMSLKHLQCLFVLYNLAPTRNTVNAAPCMRVHTALVLS